MKSYRNRKRERRGRAKRGPIVFFIAIIILSSSILVFSARRPSGPRFSITTKAPSDETYLEPLTVTLTTLMIPVHIDGEVKDPGVYYVKDGALLFELIEVSGGFTDDADRSQFNLAMRLTAHMKIYVPCIGDMTSQELVQSHEPSERRDRKIDLNRATREELETLPGIGPSTADAIISFRDANGAFERIEDLMLVPGIKEGRFARLKDHLTVSAP